MNQIIGIVDAYAWRAIAAGIVFPAVGGAAARPAGRRGGDRQVDPATPALCLAEIERIAGDDEFLAGERISLADLMVAPIVYYLGKTPEGPALLAPHEKLRAWIGRIENRQSFQVTKPPHM